jgi:RimJ/RimL family protein N-acetyltransferase
MFARTERLLLRPSWPEDSKALYEAVADEAIVRNLALAPWPYTPRDAADFACIEHPTLYPNFLLWQRTDAAPLLVGSCGINNRDGQPELGYWIARSHWGLGFASEAARAVLAVANALGHRRLVSGHFTDNPASGRVLRKVGFRATGQTEMRHSRARGIAVPCALFEYAFDDDLVDDATGMRTTPTPRYPVQAMAA